jgi:hypothetical protein
MDGQEDDARGAVASGRDFAQRLNALPGGDQELPREQVRQGMLAQGLPEEIPARLLGSLAGALRAAPFARYRATPSR